MFTNCPNLIKGIGSSDMGIFKGFSQKELGRCKICNFKIDNFKIDNFKIDNFKIDKVQN